MQKIQKVRTYLRHGDLSGLAREGVSYLNWRLQTSYNTQLDLTGRIQDLRAKYGIGKESQYGETAILRKLLRHHPRPYLVDVGAHDGRSWSNSRGFMLRGWHGILVEPLPKVFTQLAYIYRNNPKATCLNLACTDRSGQQPLYVGTDGDIGMGSTLCEDDNEWFADMRGDTAITVRTETLTGVLNQADWPQDFALLLVDAEGMDYEVLCGLDFSRYQPSVIVTEEYVANPAKHQAKYDLLRTNGYRLHQVTVEGANAVWLAPSFAVVA
ncbi:MAG: FkbM family methyltransferase [Caldilineaceae bacterium]